MTLVALGFATDSVDGANQRPIETALHTVDFQLVSGVSRAEAIVPARATERFSLVGVTWSDPRADLQGTIKLRTRTVGSGRWSSWQDLDTDRELGPEPGSKEGARRLRGSTDPLWVGQSDGVEVRAVAASGRSSDKLPPGLRLDLVDPGESPGRKPGAAGNGRGRVGFEPVAYVGQQAMAAAEPTPTEPAPTESPSTEPAPSQPATSTEPTATASPDPSGGSTPTPTATASPTPTAIVNPIPAPKLVTRAGWQADESIVTDPPAYGTAVNAVFVHHTAGSNTYSCADSAAIVRAIQAYHVKSNGWNDIGYNFLVDKCGTLFEGRKGGIDQPVIGAQTLGFNTNTTGIAVLGTYISAGVSNTVQDVIAHVAAYKLGKYGNDPAGKVTLVAGVDTGKYKAGTSVVMNRIAGHRDGVPTECPGDALYAQLPTIRAKAANVTGLAITSLSGGANKSGSTYYTKGAATVSWSVSTPTTLMSRFEILVDGAQVATASASARSAAVTLNSGRYTLQVRGVHLRGTTATTAGQTVVVDTVAPRFTRRPDLRMRTGTVTTAAVPVTLAWRAVDDIALRSASLVSPQAVTLSANAVSLATTAKPGTATTWTMRADDWAGNTSSMSTTWNPVLLAETSATRGGTWSSTTSTSYLGGAALTSRATNASLSWTFTGRSASFIASRTPSSGQVYVYVDGIKVATVDLVANTTAHRQAVWAMNWDTSATHTVKIVVAGTSGRPSVTTDGIAYMK